MNAPPGRGNTSAAATGASDGSGQSASLPADLPRKAAREVLGGAAAARIDEGAPLFWKQRACPEGIQGWIV